MTTIHTKRNHPFERFTISAKLPKTIIVHHTDGGEIDYSQHRSFDAACAALAHKLMEENDQRRMPITFMEARGIAAEQLHEYDSAKLIADATTGYDWPFKLGYATVLPEDQNLDAEEIMARAAASFWKEIQQQRRLKPKAPGMFTLYLNPRDGRYRTEWLMNEQSCLVGFKRIAQEFDVPQRPARMKPQKLFVTEVLKLDTVVRL